MKNKSAFILSGTASGSGKTTIALGLMAAFARKKIRIAPFKCGPDFIDPGLHQLVTGEVSRNLDIFMMGEKFSKKTFFRNSAKYDLTIVEGVMGMFDGGISSSAALSKSLQLPTILVLDVRSMAESAAAIIKGFEVQSDEEGADIRGVILNRVGSERHLQLIKDSICKNCHTELLGYLPREVKFTIPNRHLGLLTGDEKPLSKDSVEHLAETIAQYIDLGRLLEVTKKQCDVESYSISSCKKSQCKIAVARDRAFCFYYDDNFDLLRAAGAELVFFSPMSDTSMPKADALYLGGGYPELYADFLSKNSSMLESIRAFIDQGKPLFAECGGFMYLTEGIGTEKAFFPLLGHFPVQAKMNSRRTALGYRELTTTQKTFFGGSGTILRGHEFHYSTITPMPQNIERVFLIKKDGKDIGAEGYKKGNVIGGYMHIHLGFSPQAAESFIDNAIKNKN